MNVLDIQKAIVESMSYLIDGIIEKNNKKMTCIISGRIKSIDGNDKFTVTINKQEYHARSHFEHKVGDVVYILIPNGNWSNLIIVY